MMADEASSEFRPKIISLLNRVSSHSSRVRDGILLEHRNKLVVDSFSREVFESQKKDNIPLLHFVHMIHMIHMIRMIHFVHFDDLKCLYILASFSTFSFNDLLFEFLSLTVNVRLFE
jgi:hypothetical protein